MQSSTPRTIKSFVIRQGRMTISQRSAFERLANEYCIKPEALNSCLNGNNKVVLEIGFGMGDAIIHYAKAHPDTLFLGIDVHVPGIGRVLAEMEKQKIANIRLIQGDAVEILKNHIPDESLTAVHIFFPDPWPKARHYKRRIINTEFAHLIAKKLKNNGLLHLATDWENYAQWMRDIMDVHPDFKKLSEDRDERPLTKFEARGIRLGHTITDLRYQKIKGAL